MIVLRPIYDYGKEQPRSPDWPKFRASQIAKHPYCSACGGTDCLELHHIEPFSLHPERELDPANVVVLCESRILVCHYHYGHNGLSWRSFNPHVIADAAQFLARRKENPPVELQ